MLSIYDAVRSLPIEVAAHITIQWRISQLPDIYDGELGRYLDALLVHWRDLTAKNAGASSGSIIYVRGRRVFCLPEHT